MKYILIFIFFMFHIYSKGQRNDNIWLIHHSGSTTSQIDFKAYPPVITLTQKIPFTGTNASFSDDSGNLLFYTNGLQINNKLDLLMENGDSINSGFIAELFTGIGYPVINGAFFIPTPDDSTMYYLFHMFQEKIPDSYILSKLYYSLIAGQANNGLGKVLEKNIPLLSGDMELNFNHANAVKHANGRDWWIIVPHRLKPQYFRILLSPEGFSTPEVQEIGFKIPTVDPNFYGGINLFSQKGDKYVDYDFRTGIQIFDFDRCTGMLSNPYKIDYEPGPFDNNGQSGMAFSPSGRFLYLTQVKNLGIELLQYDLSKTDISNSKYLIANCEAPAGNNYECSIGMLLLGPDNKVYISALIDTVAFHIIHHPDSLGAACDFNFGGFVFPEKFPFGVFPYFPNYRLYDVPGSACDTLGIDAPPGPVSAVSRVEEGEVRVFPNPARYELYLQSGNPGKEPVMLRLFSLTGQQVRTWKIAAGQKEERFSLDGLAGGIYYWQAMTRSGMAGNGKVVVIR